MPRVKKNKKHAEEIEVRVARAGGEVKKYTLDIDSTVEDALDAAGIDYNRRDRVRINGDIAELDDVLEDGDRVTIAGKIQGGKDSSQLH